MACSEQSPWRHSGGTHWDENRARSLEINTYINQIKNHVFNDVNVDIQTSKTEINSNIVKFWLAILQNQLTWRHVGFRALAPIKHLLAVLFCQATRTISIQFLKCFKECRQSFFDSLHHNSSGRSSTCCIHMYPLYFSFFPKQFCKIWQIFSAWTSRSWPPLCRGNWLLDPPQRHVSWLAFTRNPPKRFIQSPTTSCYCSLHALSLCILPHASTIEYYPILLNVLLPSQICMVPSFLPNLYPTESICGRKVEPWFDR